MKNCKGWQAVHVYRRETVCWPNIVALKSMPFDIISVLNNWQSSDWFCMRFQFLFFIKASLKVMDTNSWYFVKKGNISFSFLLLCFRSADFLFFIAAFLSNCVGSLCPTSVFTIWNSFLKRFFRGVCKEGFSFDKFILRRNPPGNWVILILSGQKLCTRII